MNRRLFLWAIATAAVAGCKSGSAPSKALARDTEAAPSAAPTLAAAPAAAPVAPEAPAEKKMDPVKWPAGVEWNTWDEGLAKARAQSKPLLVVVYADWCPKCRSLAPIFGEPEVAALAKQFVMVRQNHDDDPEWLRPMNGKTGTYVPRIFFFDAKGKMREDVTSGHPRYPYFYAAQQPEFLKQAMRRAIGA